MKPWLKKRNNRSACVNIFSEVLLTDKFRYYLRMNATSYYWSYIDFCTLTFLYYLHLYLHSMNWLFYHVLSLTIYCSTFFSFLQLLLFPYAMKTVELMTYDAVSFEKVFHWTKYLAFESQKLLSLKCFVKA